MHCVLGAVRQGYVLTLVVGSKVMTALYLLVCITKAEGDCPGQLAARPVLQR